SRSAAVVDAARRLHRARPSPGHPARRSGRRRDRAAAAARAGALRSPADRAGAPAAAPVDLSGVAIPRDRGRAGRSVQVPRRLADTAAAIPVFSGDIEGVRDVAWDGLTPAGTLAPPGRYELVIEGRSALGLGTDSARVFVDLRQEVEPLEDTLPDLIEAEILP